MALKLYIERSSEEKGFGPLEVFVNVETGVMSINGVNIELNNYSHIGGPEVRDGKFPALKIAYRFNDYESRAKGASVISDYEGLKVKCVDDDVEKYVLIRREEGKEDTVEGGVKKISQGVPLLDLIFPEDSIVVCANRNISSAKYK